MIIRHTIEHTLDFRYSAPARASVMTLYLCPLQDRDQVLLEFAIETDPSGPVFAFRGPFNNRGHFPDRPRPHERLVVRTRCRWTWGRRGACRTGWARAGGWR